MKRLDKTFYESTDVLALSRALLGKYLVTEIEGARTVGRIGVDQDEYSKIQKDAGAVSTVSLSRKWFETDSNKDVREIDVLKDTLYTAAKGSWLRRSAQTGLFGIMGKLVKVMAPMA